MPLMEKIFSITSDPESRKPMFIPTIVKNGWQMLGRICVKAIFASPMPRLRA